MSATLLSPGRSVRHEFVDEGERKVYVHVVMQGRTQPEGGARVRVNGEVELGEGDGAFVRGGRRSDGEGLVLESVGEKVAECLVFDMG